MSILASRRKYLAANGWGWHNTGGMGEMIERETEVFLTLTQDEASDLFFRCLSSPGDDTVLSERVLGKIAKALAAANEAELRLAA